jgi:putative acetyltransferase
LKSPVRRVADTLTIESVDPLHPQALVLLGEAAVEARALYPDLFSPDTPQPTNVPLAERELYLLARRGEQAIGCGALRSIDALTGEVRRMFVIEHARRAGVARALLEQLEAGAQSLGYRHLVLETGSRQKPAIALYRSAGWRRIAAFGPFIGDPMSVCFGKSLA